MESKNKEKGFYKQQNGVQEKKPTHAVSRKCKDEIQYKEYRYHSVLQYRGGRVIIIDREFVIIKNGYIGIKYYIGGRYGMSGAAARTGTGKKRRRIKTIRKGVKRMLKNTGNIDTSATVKNLLCMQLNR